MLTNLAYNSVYPILSSGFMQNNDVPMHIANNCDGDYFVGCLDEVRLHSEQEVAPIHTHTPHTLARTSTHTRTCTHTCMNIHTHARTNGHKHTH